MQDENYVKQIRKKKFDSYRSNVPMFQISFENRSVIFGFLYGLYLQKKLPRYFNLYILGIMYYVLIEF